MRHRGLTLAEILVVCLLLGLFGLMALGSLQLSFRQWGTVSQKYRAAQRARFVLETMQNELRQGLPWRDATDGYLRLGPAAAPTALLLPNEGQPTAAELEFTEPHPDFYFPLDEGWNAEASSNFRNVTYRVRGGNEVLREVRAHIGMPTPVPQVEIIASAAPRTDGQAAFELELRYLDANLCELSVTAREGTAAETVRTNCFIVGR